MKQLRLCICTLVSIVCITQKAHCTDPCFAQSGYNGTLSFSSTTTSIPNDMAPTGWSKVSSPDQARTGIQIDCTTLPLISSNNGGTWTRMADKVTIQEAIYRNISGLTINTYYEISFEQSLVKNWGRSSGHVNVTFGTTTLGSANIALPAASVAQTPWTYVTVGPFLATSTTMTLTLAAYSNKDGVGSNAMPGSCSGYTQNALAADLMIDDISICPIATLPLSFLSCDITKKNYHPTLSWNILDTENELDKFVVSKSADLVSWSDQGIVSTKNTEGEYSLPINIQSAAPYYFKVVAYAKNGEILSISPIVTDGALGKTSNSCNWQYNKSVQQLSMPVSSKMEVALLSIQGQTLTNYLFEKSEAPILNVASLPDGLYILISSDGEESCEFKFVK